MTKKTKQKKVITKSKKIYKPNDYSISQKVGVFNKEPVKNLMEKIFGNNSDHDFNSMMTGIINVINNNDLTKKVAEEVILTPDYKKLKEIRDDIAQKNELEKTMLANIKKKRETIEKGV